MISLQTFGCNHRKWCFVYLGRRRFWPSWPRRQPVQIPPNPSEGHWTGLSGFLRSLAHFGTVRGWQNPLVLWIRRSGQAWTWRNGQTLQVIAAFSRVTNICHILVLFRPKIIDSLQGMTMQKVLAGNTISLMLTTDGQVGLKLFLLKLDNLRSCAKFNSYQYTS